MSTPTRSSFGRYVVTLPMSCIIPQHEAPLAAAKGKSCFAQIASSLKNVGLIEPLVVHEQGEGKYILIDGNTRYAILKSMNVHEVACILAKDDEAYTYNRRVSHIPPIQQHFMLLRVLANGVSEERVAAALNVDVKAIRKNRDLLKGICPEVVHLLEGRRLTDRAFGLIRKMKPLRQIEAAEHMIASNIFTASFLKAILAVTKSEMLVEARGTSGSCSKANSLEREHEGLVRNLKAIENSYGIDMLTLAVSLRYLGRVLANATVSSYLARKNPEALALLTGLIEPTLEASSSAA